MNFSRSPRAWNSLGSEDEVVELQEKNLRPLFEIEVESKFPIYEGEVTFKTRNVNDARDGYIELLPDERYPLTVVNKKRVRKKLWLVQQ